MVVSEKEVGGTDMTEVQTEVGVGGTEVGGSLTAATGIISEEEVGETDRTEVQTWVGMGGTGVGGSGTARAVVVSRVG